MSISDIVLDDDDNCSLSPAKNSDHDDDGDSCTSTYHAHRSCSRYASCNKTKHKCPSTTSAFAPRSIVSCGPRRGDLRIVDNQPGHRQKYDGTKWRRICCIPDCLRCLNRGIYFENWLCRKHYLPTIDLSSDSDSSVIIEENRTSPRKKVIRKPLTRPSSQRKIGVPRRGDIVVQDDGTRRKYDGQSWRLVCHHATCKCLAAAHGCCRRHDLHTRKKNSKSTSISVGRPPSNSNPTVSSTSVSTSSITRSRPSKASQLQRGDIQLVRQQWNGTKWYSLCHHPSGNCTKRSAGARCGHLCHVHYRERQEKQTNQTSIDGNEHSSVIERTISFSGSGEGNQTSSITNQPGSKSQTASGIDRTEQIVQTELTYSLDTTDLRQACIFVDEDTFDDSHSRSSPDANQSKPETDDCRDHETILSANSMPLLAFSLDCKLEIRKLELH